MLCRIHRLDRVEMSHDQGSSRLGVVPGMDFYGISSASVSMNESDLLQPMDSVLCVVVVDLPTSILLQHRLDLGVQIFAVVPESPSRRAGHDVM